MAEVVWLVFSELLDDISLLANNILEFSCMLRAEITCQTLVIICYLLNLFFCLIQYLLLLIPKLFIELLS